MGYEHNTIPSTASAPLAGRMKRMAEAEARALERERSRTYLVPGRSDDRLSPRELFVRKAQTDNGMSFEDAEAAWDQGARLVSQLEDSGGIGGMLDSTTAKKYARPYAVVQTVSPRYMADALMMALPVGRAATVAEKAPGILSRIFRMASTGSVRAREAAVLESAWAKADSAYASMKSARGMINSGTRALNSRIDAYLGSAERFAADQALERVSGRFVGGSGHGLASEFQTALRAEKNAILEQIGPTAERAASEMLTSGKGAAHAADIAARDAYVKAVGDWKQAMADVQRVRDQQASFFGDGVSFGDKASGAAKWLVKGAGNLAKGTIGPGVVRESGTRVGVAPTLSWVLKKPAEWFGPNTGGFARWLNDGTPWISTAIADGTFGYIAYRGYENDNGGRDAGNAAVIDAAKAEDQARFAEYTTSTVLPATSTTDVTAYRAAIAGVYGQYLQDRRVQDMEQRALDTYKTRARMLLGNQGMVDAVRSSYVEDAAARRFERDNPALNASDYRGNENPKAKAKWDKYVRDADAEFKPESMFPGLEGGF